MINFSGTENASNLIDLEKVSLMSALDIQKSFNKQILVFVKKIMANINFSLDIDPNDKAFFYLNESTNALNLSNSNINALKDLSTALDKIDPSDENSIKNYNTQFKEIMNSVYTNTEIIEKFIYKINVEDFSELPVTCANTVVEEVSNTSTSSDELSSQFVENTLVISETQKKVILPYNINKIENILQNNSIYHSIEDVINKLYTRPISFYKLSPIARFKEAYKLVKEKEKGSSFKALSLAFELFGNYSLHPAIITACKSLDELDIYLACLEENDLDSFRFFNIKYEVPLAISKLTSSTLGISKLAKNNL